MGDVLPIANTLAMEQLGYVTELELSTVLSPKEYLFGTEAMKALAYAAGPWPSGRTRA